jgi:protein tyrosine phosphatase (PTP) superfamily phosphohydrolase (DUF442 family)
MLYCITAPYLSQTLCCTAILHQIIHKQYAVLHYCRISFRSNMLYCITAPHHSQTICFAALIRHIIHN